MLVDAAPFHPCYLQTAKHKRPALVWGGIVGGTALALANRLFLMNHSWNPEGETVLSDRMSSPGDEKTSLPLPV